MDMDDTDVWVSTGDVIHTPSFSYLVEAFIGEGTFGKVLDMLTGLRCLDPDVSGIVRFLGHFNHGSHICLEFELLDMSLRDLVLQAEHNRLPLMQIRNILKEMATALEYLGHLKIIHADLKLRNIMVSRQGRFRLIDFGSSMYESQAKTGVICQTIWYRSPEIMLGLPFTGQIDMWSLGCIAAELLTGRPMYLCKTEYDVTHGELPDAMLDNGTRTQSCFTKGSGEAWRLKKYEESKGVRGRLPHQIPFESLEAFFQAGNVPITSSFADLLKRMLELDPDKRITPSKLLEHPFMRWESEDSCSSESSGDNPNRPIVQTKRVSSPHTYIVRTKRVSSPHTYIVRTKRVSSPHTYIVQIKRVPAPHTPIVQTKRVPAPHTPIVRTKRVPAPHTPIVRTKRVSSPHTYIVRTKRVSSPHTPIVRTKRVSSPHTYIVRTKRVSSPHTYIVRTKRVSSPHTPIVRTKRVPAPHTPIVRTKRVPAPHTPIVRTKRVSSPHTYIVRTKRVSSPHTYIVQTKRVPAPHTPIVQTKRVPAPHTPIVQTKRVPAPHTPIVQTKRVPAPHTPIVQTKRVPAPHTPIVQTKRVPAPHTPIVQTKRVPAPHTPIVQTKRVPAPHTPIVQTKRVPAPHTPIVQTKRVPAPHTPIVQTKRVPAPHTPIVQTKRVPAPHTPIVQTKRVSSPHTYIVRTKRVSSPHTYIVRTKRVSSGFTFVLRLVLPVELAGRGCLSGRHGNAQQPVLHVDALHRLVTGHVGGGAKGTMTPSLWDEVLDSAASLSLTPELHTRRRRRDQTVLQNIRCDR
ncbi:hypothetical protein CRUP_036119 [Coryphaenoides rupestris]|nr:hypothetical protein CRUP_036119 [Coryphaenoides rupestris]